MLRWFLTFFFGSRCSECLRRARWGSFDSKKRNAKVTFWCEDHYHGTSVIRIAETLERQM